jgi:hypothetical protein
VRHISIIIGGTLVVLALVGPACGGSGDTSQDSTAEDGMEDAADLSPDADRDDVPDGPEDSAEACIPSGVEVCDGVDNDCDGETDEDFDLLGDERNCGVCGYICLVAGGTPACVDGLCRIADCDDGRFDLNGAVVDGCEYECTATAAAESLDDGTCADTLDNDCDGRVDVEDTDCADCVPEFCDALDNDCDGLTDEDFDLQTDPIHCGSCGADCAVHPHSVPACVRGECTINCEAGWVDEDRVDANGCELRCTMSPTLDETACDGIDADCDGWVDEDYIPDVCGTGECQMPAVCRHGVEDCVPLEPAYLVDAVCDGLDQDCDGNTDEDYVPSNLCSGVCRETATCTDGVETCGAPLAAADLLCDGDDEDCDGAVDEDYVPFTCGSGGCIRTSTCIGGVEDCITGSATTELCNGSDDNCDGIVDNGVDASMCPPPPQVLTTTCASCGPGCGRCAITPDGCNETWYDINGAYIDGCECQQEATEASSGSCPDSVRDLGDMSDVGSTVEVRGNCVPVGDVDWYVFRALDIDDTDCDAFHVVVEFVTNPDLAFRFNVYRGDELDDCLARPECEEESVRYDRAMDFRTGSGRIATGECPCRAANTYDFNLCTNDTQYFFVEVYRPGTTTTCDSYTLRIGNNPP